MANNKNKEIIKSDGKTSIALTKYKKNPFLDDFEVVTTNKQIRLSNGKGGDLVLQNRDSGEEKSTHVVSYRKVDTEVFIKLFTQNISLMFGLSATGTKAFTFVVWLMQMGHNIRKDQVYIDSDEDRKSFIEWELDCRKKCFASKYHEQHCMRVIRNDITLAGLVDEINEVWEKRKEKSLNFSKTTFIRGLANLAENHICAKSVKPNIFFINPNIVFNGDRIAFSTVIEKQKEEDRDSILKLMDKGA